MSGLPKVDLPVYEHFLVGMNKKVKFRCFTVKEQKILLTAKEEQGIDQQLLAVKQVVELCTMGKVDVDTLPYFDLEDLFLQIRIKSVSDTSDIGYEYVDKEGAKTPIDVKIDLKEAKVVTLPNHNKTIKFSDTIGIVMRYPSITEMTGNINQEDLVIKCIESIFTKDEIYNTCDFSTEDMEAWLDGLGTEQLMKIKEFYDTMPRLRLEKEIDLPDDRKHKLVFEGLESFFA